MSIEQSSTSESEVSSTGSIGTFKRALRKKQVAYNRLTVRLADLEQHIANITNQRQTPEVIPSETKQQPRKYKNQFIADPDRRLEVQNFARQFTYMNSFWLRPSYMEIFRLAPNPDYIPQNRYLSDEEKQQGTLFDLLGILPEKWHGETNDELFIRQFVHEMTQQRSNARSRLHQAGPLILGCTNEVFNNKDQRANTFKELIGFTGGIGEDGKQAYQTLAPILYEDNHEQTDKKWTIFRSPILMKMYSALVRGPGSLKGLNEGQITHKDSHASLERKWGIRAITPGAIAMAAMLARFVASADDTLLPCGSETGINYQRDYEFYFQYLHKGLHENKVSVLSIFRTWNDIFYPNSEECLNRATATEPEDLNALFDELDANEVEEQPGEDNQLPGPAGQNPPDARSSTPPSLNPNQGDPSGAEMVSVLTSVELVRLIDSNFIQPSPLSDPPSGNSQRYQLSPLRGLNNICHSDHEEILEPPSQPEKLANKKSSNSRSGKRKAIVTDPDEEVENLAPWPVKQPRRSGRARRH